jgi:hypothetical protein
VNCTSESNQWLQALYELFLGLNGWNYSETFKMATPKIMIGSVRRTEADTSLISGKRRPEGQDSTFIHIANPQRHGHQDEGDVIALLS